MTTGDRQIGELRDLVVKTTRGGEHLEITYKNRKVANISLMNLKELLNGWSGYLDEVGAAPVKLEGEDDDMPVVVRAEVEAFITAYEGIREKYSGIGASFRKEKWFEPFVKATAQAKDLGLKPSMYIERLVARYSAMRGNTLVPWPNQLHGTTALAFLQDYSASKTTNPLVEAEKAADAARRKPLNEDGRYLEAKERVRKNRHDEVDLAYIRARQMNAAGRVKDWVEKAQQWLDDRRRADDAKPVGS